MGQRIGIRRLNALNKTGQSVTGSLGGGVSGSVGSRKIMKSGNEIVTEIYVDLGSSKGPLYQPGNAGEIIAHSASTDSGATMTAGNGNLTQVTLKENGIVTLVEMTCVETPTGGDVDIDLVHAAALQKFSGSTSLTTLINAGDAVIGAENAAALDDNSLQDQYLYLATGDGAAYTADAAEYTDGKFLIRLYGHTAPDDV